jgi:outer membrane protein assembly factor BamB/tetratricopeptide (TPR) repeat protein
MLVLWQAAAVRADNLSPVVLSGESRAAASRFAEARKRLQDKKWAEAIEELQGILNTVGDELVPLDEQHSLHARRLCHLQIAALPPSALALYRNRIEPQARKWLEEAVPSRDVRLLRQIVDDAFCSRAAEKALDLLGDLAFERGRFDEAESWWRLLSPLPPVRKAGPNEVGDLVYPDFQGDRARVEAKQLLARLFRGWGPNGTSELNAFAGRYPTAQGKLAGRSGRYAALLEELARQRQKETLPQPVWSTFGGNASRSLVVPGSPDITEQLGRLCRGGPTWRFSLEERTRLEGAPGAPLAPPDSRRARSVAFYPAIVWPYLLVADARYVTAHDLRTGESSTWYDAAQLNGGINPTLKLPAPPDLRYTLTVDGDRVYVRLGLQGVQDVRAKPKADFGERRQRNDNTESLLVCLSAAPGPGGDHQRWMVRAMEKEAAVFEGAPVVQDGLVCIAATRFEGARNITAILCYPADPEDSKPQLRWRQDVCETRELRPGDERYRHHLLTRAGSLLVYCSHSGAIVALDSITGRRVWGVRYPRRESGEPEANPPLRDLAPCLFAEGKLYVAPADSESLLCLDPATGQILWERQEMRVLHLLGVGSGKLIFTTRDGLQAIGAADGDNKNGWMVPHGGGGLKSMGRGLLLGDLVLWPTVPENGRPYGVLAVRQEDGEQPDDPTLLHRIPSGNLVYSDGCLAVADAETLSVFVPPGRRLVERQGQVQAAPDSASARFELARAEADVGHYDSALGNFVEAERLAGKGESRLINRVRAEHRLVLARWANQAVREQSWTGAEKALGAAGRLSLTPGDRLDVQLRIAQMWQNAGQSARALAAWQDILSTEDWRTLVVLDPEGAPHPASWAAAQAIAALIREKGPSLYEPFEKKARLVWEATSSEGRPGVAERLAQAYPEAAITRIALAEAGRGYLNAKRPGAAAHVYRLLLQFGVTGREQAETLLGLARCYERQQCWQAARVIWERLARDHGSALLPALSPDRAMRDFVTEHLRSPPFTAPSPASLALPLSKLEAISLGPGEFCLPMETCQSPLPSDSFFTAAISTPLALHPIQGELICRGTRPRVVVWRRSLPFVPAWVGAYRDLIVTAGERGAACVRREDGGLVWEFAAPARAFYPPPDRAWAVPGDLLPAEMLSGFRLVAGRVFCFQGQKRLLALDAECGRVLWQLPAPDATIPLSYPHGRFFPRYHVSTDTVLVQTASGRRWILDVATGRLLHDADTVRTPWTRAPLPVDERTVGLVVDSRRILLLDLPTGQERWTHTLSGVTTLSGEPPLVLGTANTLVLVTPTNIGYELQRLDLATGGPLWSRSWLLKLSRLDPSGWSLDGETIYYAAEAAVFARSLQDGKVLWENPLDGPPVVRSLQRAGSYLLVYPAQTRKVRFQFHWLRGSLEWVGGPTLNEAGVFALDCMDAKTGHTVQRCLCECEAPGLRTRASWVEPFRLVPTMALEGVKVADPWPNAEVSPPLVRIAVGRQVWTWPSDGSPR